MGLLGLHLVSVSTGAKDPAFGVGVCLVSRVPFFGAVRLGSLKRRSVWRPVMVGPENHMVGCVHVLCLMPFDM